MMKELCNLLGSFLYVYSIDIKLSSKRFHRTRNNQQQCYTCTKQTACFGIQSIGGVKRHHHRSFSTCYSRVIRVVSNLNRWLSSIVYCRQGHSSKYSWRRLRESSCHFSFTRLAHSLNSGCLPNSFGTHKKRCYQTWPKWRNFTSLRHGHCSLLQLRLSSFSVAYEVFHSLGACL